MNNTIESKGVYFNLNTVFASLNERFFSNTISARIKWGQKRTILQKRSIKLGSYHPTTKVIIINPCLDQAIVPYICLERIVFHEMLHQHLPARKNKAGKNVVHYKEFYHFEKNYPYLTEADTWFKTNLHRLLKF